MNIEFMLNALDIAKTSDSDVPVGAVIVKDGKIIASGVNEREKRNVTAAHAEMLAIFRANKKLCSAKLTGCEIYVTLEPCPMCAAAILQSGIGAVFFGAYDLLYGAFGSKCDMRQIMNIKADVKGGIKEEECSLLLRRFFKELRK